MRREDHTIQIIELRTRYECELAKRDNEINYLRDQCARREEKYKKLTDRLKVREKEVLLLKGNLSKYKAVNTGFWTGATNFYPLPAVQSFLYPHMKSIELKCATILSMCNTALTLLASSGGTGGRGGGGGSGQQNSKLDRVLAAVQSAQSGVKEIGEYMHRFEEINLPLQAKFVANLYNAHTHTIRFAKDNVPVLPHAKVLTLLDLLFMSVRQRLSPPEISHVPDFEFDGTGFCNMGQGSDTVALECSFETYDAAVCFIFSNNDGNHAPQQQGILRSLYAGTLNRYETMRMLVPVLEQLWKRSQREKSKTFSDHTLQFIGCESIVNGNKRRRVSATVSRCTIKR